MAMPMIYLSFMCLNWCNGPIRQGIWTSLSFSSEKMVHLEMLRDPPWAMWSWPSYSKPRAHKTLYLKSKHSWKGLQIKRYQSSKQWQMSLNLSKRPWHTTNGLWYKNPCFHYEEMPWWQRKSWRKSWDCFLQKSIEQMCCFKKLSQSWKKPRNSANRNPQRDLLNFITCRNHTPTN